MRRVWLICGALLLSFTLPFAHAQEDEKPWVVYEGGDGPGHGKHIVLVSGDEEYRSEETLPQLGKILAKEHGFKCTVLFAIDPKDGTINPRVNYNIPGLEALASADLMIIFTRFRDLPDEQMKHVDEYLATGKPVIGLRTATHAFQIKKSKTYIKYTNVNKDPAYEGGFGRQILGETWINHLVPNGKGSTRGLIAKGQENNPIVRGIKDGDIWGVTGIYEVRLPMLPSVQPVIMGQALQGMKASDEPYPDTNKYNNPMMPVAWTNNFKTPEGKTGRAFATTMGSAQDFSNEGLRRLLVNATYWSLGMENQIPEHTQVDLVGTFQPTRYGSGGHVPNVKPASLKM